MSPEPTLDAQALAAFEASLPAVGFRMSVRVSDRKYWRHKDGRVVVTYLDDAGRAQSMKLDPERLQ